MVQPPATAPPTLIDRALALIRITAPVRPVASSAALIVANLIPLWGVLFGGWDVFTIMLLFWTENVVVGVFNVLRMLTAQPTSLGHWLGKLFIVPFFCFHYGMFTAVHGVFVMALFSNNVLVDGYTNGQGLAAIMRLFYQLQDHTNHVFGFALASLVISHGVSFVVNYLGRGEFTTASVDSLMGRPYGRVIMLHLTLIFGAFLSMALGSPTAVIAVLVALKIWFDLAGHWKEREKMNPPGAKPTKA